MTEKENNFNKGRLSSLQGKRVLVYCPDKFVSRVDKVLQRLNLGYVINNFSDEISSNDILCHYHLEGLDQEHRDILINAMEYGFQVMPLVSFLDDKLGYTEIELLSDNYFLHQKAFSILMKPRSQKVKRLVDIVVGSILLVIFFPVALIAALAIKLDSKGPIFFQQLRTGQFNREFKVIKFRSMTNDAEKDGAKWATKNDPRITKVGNFIRKTRIDELPQLLNVIKGEMSLVGPRPEREVFIKELEKSIPYYRFRHAVKPGITGLAQVSYKYGETVEDAQWKHRYDIYYIKHHKSFMDLKILLKTVQVVLLRQGQ